jgi:N-acetylglucosaminyl-diphospho-decaprenol L-rhamnosyltransferase
MEDTELTPSGPKTSVLIVSHNSAAALRRCLSSLMETTARDAVEVLVVDKGSRDGSGQLDAEFPDAKFLRLERNFGFTKAANIGVRTALGEYVLFLDPGVEMKSKAVEAMVQVLDAESDVVAVCPLLVDEAGKPLSRFRRVVSGAELVREWKSGGSAGFLPADLNADRLAVEWPPRACVLVRKQFIRGMNFFDQRFGEFGADLELFFQIRNAGKRVVLLPQIRLVWRPVEQGYPEDARAQLSADEALGIAVYGAKHGGLLEGLGIRLSCIFHVLGKLLTFKEPGYQLARLSALVSGQKIDGTQSAI